MIQNIEYKLGNDSVWVAIIPDGSMWIVKNGNYIRTNYCPFTGTPAPTPMSAKNTGGVVEWIES